MPSGFPDIQVLPVASIKPCPSNNKRHSQRQVAQIMASVEEFGWTKPILVDEDFEILAGHGGRLAAINLGMEHVPCIVLDHLSDSQKRAYRIADNKIAENSEWDWTVVADEVSALVDYDYDVDLLGFDEQELEAILRQAESFLPPKPVPPPPVPVQAHERQPLPNDSRPAVSPSQQKQIGLLVVAHPEMVSPELAKMIQGVLPTFGKSAQHG